MTPNGHFVSFNESINGTSKQRKRKEQNRAAQRAFRQRKEKYEKELKDQVSVLSLKLEEVQAEKEELKDRITTAWSRSSLQRCSPKHVADEQKLQNIQHQFQAIVEDLSDTASEHKECSLQRDVLLKVLRSIKSLAATALSEPENARREMCFSCSSKCQEHHQQELFPVAESSDLNL